MQACKHVLNKAFNELSRQAIMADPEWSNGDYLKLNYSYPAQHNPMLIP